MTEEIKLSSFDGHTRIEIFGLWDIEIWEVTNAWLMYCPRIGINNGSSGIPLQGCKKGEDLDAVIKKALLHVSGRLVIISNSLNKQAFEVIDLSKKLKNKSK